MQTRQVLSDEDIAYVQQHLTRYWRSKARPEMVEELVQDGLAQCVAKIDKYEARVGHEGKKAALKTFLMTVAKRKGIDTLRKDGRRRTQGQRLLVSAESYVKSLLPHVRSGKPPME